MADREIKLTYKISDDGTLRVLDDVKLKVRQVGEETERSTTQAASGFSKYQAAIVTLNQALGLAQTAFYSVKQVVDGVNESIGRVDGYAELAKSVGLTVSELTSLRVAAKQGGVELSALGRSVAFLQRVIVQSAGGGGKAKLFEQLGISQRDLAEVANGSRSTVEVLTQLGAAFDGLSRAQQVATSRELFGRGGSRVLNVLTGAMREQVVAARELGAVISDDMAGAADQAANALDEMAIASESAREAIGVALAPVVTEVATEMTEWAKANRDVVSSNVAGWAQSLKAVLSDDVLPFIRSTKQELAGIASVIDLVRNGTVSVSTEGVSVGREFSAGTGTFGGPDDITGRVRAVAGAVGTAAPARALDLGGRSAAPARATGGGAARATSARQVQDDDRRALEAANESERIRLALVQQQVELRNVSIEQAKEDLSLARESGTSQEQQLQLASRLDELERLRLVTMRERIQAELDGLLQFGPALSAEVVDLQTQLYVVDQQLSRAPEHAARMRAEFERAGEAVFDLGVTLNSGLQRAVDGSLSGGGGFDLENVVGGTLKATFSSVIGNVLQDVIQDVTTGAISDTYMKVFESFSLEGVAGAATGANGQFQPSGIGATIGGLSSTGASALFGNKNETNKIISQLGGTIGGALGGPLGGLIGGVGTAGLGKVYEAAFDSTAAQTGALASAAAFGAAFLGIGAIIGAIVGAIIDAIDAAPTQGTLVKKEIAKTLGRAGVPLQREVELGGRVGVRTEGIEASPTQAIFDEFERLGFGRSGVIRNTNLSNPILADDDPGLDRLRFGGALAVGALLGRRPRDATIFANAFINNADLLDLPESEARRYLSKVADDSGISLETGADELNRRFLSGKLTEDQLLSTVSGLADVFADDLPAGVDVAAIAVENFSEKGGLAVGEFIKDVDRAVEIFDALRDSLEGGLKSGLGSAIQGIALSDQLFAGGGSNADVLDAYDNARQDAFSALFEVIRSGLTDAITEGVFDAVQSTPAWEALTDVIAAAVTGGDLSQLPALIGDVIDSSFPALEAAAATVAQLNELVGVTPTSLRQRGESIDEQIKQVRFGGLNSTQQEAFLRRELATIDARLADDDLTDVERRRLLDRRSEIAFQGADLAAGRFSAGSVQYERAVNEWLLIAEDTANQFERFGIEQVNALDQVSGRLDENTAALRANTQALENAAGTRLLLQETSVPSSGVATATRFTRDIERFFTTGKLPRQTEARRRQNVRPL